MNKDARPGGLGFDWGAGPTFGHPCPNCGANSGIAPLGIAPLGIAPLVTVSWTGTRSLTRQQRPIHDCTACGARFYAPMARPDYHHEETRVIGWPQLHVQQNAGVWPIAAPLARIEKPDGARFLEIGGGFGFGLDFAIHGRSWQGRGIDPSRLAAKGADELSLPVTLGYFPEDDPETAPWDVIAATEVIEHVAHPGDFLAAIRKRLADDGILVLTTPDGGLIEKTTPTEALERILIPEIHMVFQTEASLRRILRDAGFPHSEIAHDADSLIAFASPVPLALERDTAPLRRRFRAYLDRRASSVDPTTDAGIGLLGRALFEAANDGDTEAAHAARDRLFAAVQSRFGLDLATIETLPLDGARTLARMKDRIPLNLAPVFYAEAMRRLAGGAQRHDVRRDLRLAVEAATALADALRAMWISDALTDSVGWAAQAELVIAAAESGDAETPASLAALGAHPGEPSARRRIAWRALIDLTNAGATDTANALATSENLDWPDTEADRALPEALRRDATFIIGQLALAGGTDLARALEAARRLGESDPLARHLLLAAFTRLINRGDLDAAAACRADVERHLHRADPADAAARDATFALGVLALNHAQDPDAALAAFTRLRETLAAGLTEGADAPALFWEALRGELLALALSGRHDDAAALRATILARHAGAPADLPDPSDAPVADTAAGEG